MRRPFTRSQTLQKGRSDEALKHAVEAGRVTRVFQGVYLAGPETPTAMERALALLVATNAVASHSLAGVLYELDGVQLSPPFVTIGKKTRIEPKLTKVRCLEDRDVTIINGYRCTNGLQTMLGLARPVLIEFAECSHCDRRAHRLPKACLKLWPFN